jgi:poly(A) polymerase
MDQVLDAQSEKLAITRRIAGDIKEIWGLQPRFEQRSGKRPYALLEHPRFRAAWDFLQLRCESGEIDHEIADWWQAFLDADGESRAELLQPARADEVKKRRRRRRKPAAGGAATDGTAAGD